MSDDAVNRDFDTIDGSGLREVEIKQLRLLLERDRARRRYAQKLRYYVGWLSLGATTLVAGNQLGLLDWIAGLIVRWRQ